MNSRVLKSPSTARKGLVLIAGLLLSACASSADTARSDPEGFTARFDGLRLSGGYNPAGFASAEVQSALSQNCGGSRLASYTERPAAGLTEFTADCEAQGDFKSGHIQIHRVGAQITLETVGSDERGQLRYGRTTIGD